MNAKMTAISPPRTDLYGFLELVLMWHCHGDIPMTRTSTCEFIEDDNFGEFLQSVQFWCKEFGLKIPTRSDVIKTLHLLYEP